MKLPENEATSTRGVPPFLTDEKAVNDYYPFGITIAERSFQTAGYRYGFGGHELENEVSGTGNHLAFGDYGYDSRTGRRWNIEPEIKKYASNSSYMAYNNSPIFYTDPDGRDVVYFDNHGNEITRMQSITRFETFVSVKENSPNAALPEFLILRGTFAKAEMPNVIQSRGKDKTTDPSFQIYDYQIAACTFLFNQNKNSTQLYTDGNQKIPLSTNKDIPLLSPTLVKAIVMQESSMGKLRPDDIMTANNPGDWGNWKLNYGLKLNVAPTPKESIEKGILILATKGVQAEGSSYKWEASTDWIKAAKKYNGNGVVGYEQRIQEMVSGSKKPSSNDYPKTVNYVESPKKEE